MVRHDTVTWDALELREFCESLLVAKGLRAADARTVVDVLLHAELRGIETHGVHRVLVYSGLLSDGVSAEARPRLVAGERPGVQVVEADNCLGPVAADLAMRECIATARRTGVAAVGVRGSNHCGALGYYAMQAAREDMVGIAVSNAPPSMAPWGGRERLLGNNPVAIAAPGAGVPPVVFDGSFARAFPLKLEWARGEGLPVPADWLLDADGTPTADPDAAGSGTFRPVGDHHGSGLALMMGLLAAALPGAFFGREMLTPDGRPRPGVDGHLMLALDCAAFGDVDEFKRRVRTIVEDLETSAAAGADGEVRVPGHRGALLEANRTANGVPVRADTHARLTDLANDLGVHRKVRHP